MKIKYSETKTEECKYCCDGCDMFTNKLFEDNYFDGLCDHCDSEYDNKTGYCSLYCCLGGGCDDSC